MATRKSHDDRPKPPLIRYAPLGELNVYEVSDAELRKLEAELEKFESGPPGQVHLSFALALLPTAVTILITLETVGLEGRPLQIYWIAFWLLFVQGLVSLARWWTTSRSHRSPAIEIRSLIEEVRSRMPGPPGLPETPGEAAGPVGDDPAR